MSVASIIDQATGKIYDDLIPQGGGINLNQGQIITATTQTEVAFPTVPPANGSVLSYDSTTDTGLRYIANNPTALALNYQELFSATAGNNITPVPPPAQNNYVLTSDNAPANPTGLAWKPPTGGGGILVANAPLFDDATQNPNKIGINFTAVKAEIPAGTGVAQVGALIPPPAHDGYVLKADAGEPTGLIWSAVNETLTAQLPLLLEEPQAGDPQLSIAFTAVKGEIPAGTGASSIGALVPAPPTDNYVLTSASAEATGLKWLPLAGPSGSITTKAPLQDLEPVQGVNEISIEFTAVKGEIPAGTGTAKEGALVPAPPTDGYVLTASSAEATGLKWLPGGSPSAQTNFFPLTYPPAVGTPFVASGFDVILPPPNTIGTFTQNEQITIMNYEPTSNPSGNSFTIAQSSFEDMTAFWTGNNTGGLENFAYFTTGTNGAPVQNVIDLFTTPLPLSGSSVSTPIASLQVGGATQLCRCNGIIRTAQYLYIYGNFTTVVVLPSTNITDVGGIIRYNMTTGVFSKCGGAVGGISTTIAGVNPPDIFCATLCPITDGLFGNYASHPRTMVLGGTFNIVASNSLSIPYICFYDEPTDTFSILGDGVGDGITAPVQVAVQTIQLKYGITSLLYNPTNNSLWVSFNNQTFTWTTDGGSQTFAQDNCVGGFIWKGGGGYSLGIDIGTPGQITNPQNLYFANGIVRSVATGKYWLCIGFTDSVGQPGGFNCWWKDLGTPNQDPLIAPNDTNTPPPLQVGSGGADIPNSLQYTYGGRTDGSSYVAFMNFQIDPQPNGTSTLIWDDFAGVGQDTVANVKGTPETASFGGCFAFQYLRPVGQTGSWTFTSTSENFCGLNTSLLPAYCLVFNVESPTFFIQKDLEDQSVGVLLFAGNGVQYIIPGQPTKIAFSVNFKQQYTSLQLVVDKVADIYRVINLYGDLEFSNQ